MKRWTRIEEAYLVSQYHKIPKNELTVLFGTTRKAITVKYNKLKRRPEFKRLLAMSPVRPQPDELPQHLPGPHSWTGEEEELLLREYSKRSTGELAKELGVTRKAVRVKYAKLRNRRNHPRPARRRPAAPPVASPDRQTAVPYARPGGIRVDLTVRVHEISSPHGPDWLREIFTRLAPASATSGGRLPETLTFHLGRHRRPIFPVRVTEAEEFSGPMDSPIPAHDSPKRAPRRSVTPTPAHVENPAPVVPAPPSDTAAPSLAMPQDLPVEVEAGESAAPELEIFTLPGVPPAKSRAGDASANRTEAAVVFCFSVNSALLRTGTLKFDPPLDPSFQGAYRLHSGETVHPDLLVGDHHLHPLLEPLSYLLAEAGEWAALELRSASRVATLRIGTRNDLGLWYGDRLPLS